jgi:hypothetical protein
MIIQPTIESKFKQTNKKGHDETIVCHNFFMVFFAALSNPDKPGALVFQQCRLISYRSFLNTLEQGGAR